jgi:aspartate racemase
MSTCIGVVGGLGPEGTVYYYRKLASALAQVPAAERPGIVVDHVWIDRFVALLRAGDEEGIASLFASSLERLRAAGARAAMIAAVTPHKFIDAIRRRSPLPLVDLVEATTEDVVRAGLRSVGLLGTRTTLTSPFFVDRLRRAGVRVVVPDEAGIAWLDELIFGPLAVGRPTPAMKDELSGVVARMTREAPVDALVVACTDLFELMDPAARLVDPIDCHVRAALAAI